MDDDQREIAQIRTIIPTRFSGAPGAAAVFKAPSFRFREGVCCGMKGYYVRRANRRDEEFFPITMCAVVFNDPETPKPEKNPGRPDPVPSLPKEDLADHKAEQERLAKELEELEG